MLLGVAVEREFVVDVLRGPFAVLGVGVLVIDHHGAGRVLPAEDTRVHRDAARQTDWRLQVGADAGVLYDDLPEFVGEDAAREFLHAGDGALLHHAGAEVVGALRRARADRRVGCHGVVVMHAARCQHGSHHGDCGHC